MMRLPFIHRQLAPSAHARDPVCGMAIDATSARWVCLFEETGYFFCSVHCWRAFDADPPRFLFEREAAG